MEIINLTAHTLNEVTTGRKIAPSGVVVRVDQENTRTAEWANIPIYSTKFGDLSGLPEPRENTLYVVSSMALNAVPAHRTDVVSPGFLKRDEKGNAIGCVGFRTK